MNTFKRLDELMATLPADRRQRIEEKANQTIAAIRLTELRKTQNITQSDIAQKMGVSQASVSKIEQRGNVQLNTLTQYAHALGATLNVEFIMPDGTHHSILAS